MDKIIATINKNLPLHSMWDGFWVNSFRSKTLIISCSFDRIYYRNFDIIFNQVIFFNLPESWRDTDIYGDDLIRMSNLTEFGKHFPDFDAKDRFIFAIDIHFEKKGILEKHVFFILAKHVYLIECKPPDANATSDYIDIYETEIFPCKKNRVQSK